MAGDAEWELFRRVFAQAEAAIRAAFDRSNRITVVDAERGTPVEFGRRSGFDPQTGLHCFVIVARRPGGDPRAILIETIPPLFREPLPFDGVFAP